MGDKKKYDLITVGFPMVEIMRKNRGVTFHEAGEFVGPYPSADTCILLDVASRLGTKCALIGVSADDEFGGVVLDRLEADGVDISHVRKIKEQDTIIVFVRYEPDGTREYLPSYGQNVGNLFNSDDIDPQVAKQAKCVHFSGEVVLLCTDPQRREAMMKLLDSIDEDTIVSLDPNFTDWNTDVKKWLSPFIERANVIFPSEGEASRMMEMRSDDEACKYLASKGKIIALKKGSRGCDIYKGNDICHVDTFNIEEVDPTGCGDSFCAGFITGLIENKSLEETGILANAAGALQATKLGPMEGAMPREYVEEFIRNNRA